MMPRGGEQGAELATVIPDIYATRRPTRWCKLMNRLLNIKRDDAWAGGSRYAEQESHP